MARNGDGDVVGPAGRADCPHSRRFADAACDVAIGHGLAGRYLAQRSPNLVLEGGAAYVEWQVEVLVRCLDVGDDFGDKLGECPIAGDQLGAREAAMQFLLERLGIVAEEYGAYALVGRSNEHQSQRARCRRVADFGIDAAGAELAGLHAQRLRGIGVEAAARIESCLVNGFGHGLVSLQRLADAFVSVRDSVRLRRHAGRGLEHAVEVVGAETSMRGELIEGRNGLSRLDQPAGRGDLSPCARSRSAGAFGLQRLQGR